jgi:hypothetical protein
MRNLEYLTVPPHNCPEDNSNDNAFVSLTTMIGGHHTVEEFMACEIWPLGACLGFVEVVEAGAPASKVLVRLQKFDVTKPDDESDETFVGKIAAHVDKLVGRYGWKEHEACLIQIPTIWLNRAFESAGIMYGASPMPHTPVSVGGPKRRKDEIVEQPSTGKTEAAPRRKISMKRKRCESPGNEKISAVEKALGSL